MNCLWSKSSTLRLRRYVLYSSQSFSVFAYEQQLFGGSCWGQALGLNPLLFPWQSPGVIMQTLHWQHFLAFSQITHSKLHVIQVNGWTCEIMFMSCKYHKERHLFHSLQSKFNKVITSKILDSFDSRQNVKVWLDDFIFIFFLVRMKVAQS